MNIEADADQIQVFVERGNYHAALNIALSSLNECRRNTDQAGINLFLRTINDISLTLAEEFGGSDYLPQDRIASVSCSICGVVEDKSALLSGTNGAICRSCAAKAHRYFANKAG